MPSGQLALQILEGLLQQSTSTTELPRDGADADGANGNNNKKPKAKPTGRKPFPEKLPRVDIEVLPPEVQQKGLDAFERIGEDIVETLEKRQASLVVVRVQGAAPHDLSWLDRLADLYLEWASTVRRPVELLYDRARDDRAPLAVLRVDGPYAYGYLKGEAGAHRFRDEERNGSGRHAVSAIARPMPVLSIRSRDCSVWNSPQICAW